MQAIGDVDSFYPTLTPQEGQESGLATMPSCETCSDPACGHEDLNEVNDDTFTNNKIIFIINYTYV